MPQLQQKTISKIGEAEVSDVLASFAECEHLNFYSNFFFNDAKEILGEFDSSLCLIVCQNTLKSSDKNSLVNKGCL